MDRVIGDMGLGAGDDIFDGQRQQILTADCGVIEQSQVRCDLLQFGIHPQNRARNAVVGRTDIGMHEGIGQHPVQIAPEQFYLAVEVFIRDSFAKWQQQRINRPQIHRHPGYRGRMVIGNHQRADRLVKVFRHRQFQPVTALCKHDREIGQHIARLVGGIALIHVADYPRIKCGTGCRLKRRVGQAVFGLKRQIACLLRRAQCRVVNDVAQLVIGVEHGSPRSFVAIIWASSA